MNFFATVQTVSYEMLVFDHQQQPILVGTGKRKEYGSQAAIYVSFDWKWQLVVQKLMDLSSEKKTTKRCLFGQCLEIL